MGGAPAAGSPATLLGSSASTHCLVGSTEAEAVVEVPSGTGAGSSFVPLHAVQMRSKAYGLAHLLFSSAAMLGPLATKPQLESSN